MPPNPPPNFPMPLSLQKFFLEEGRTSGEQGGEEPMCGVLGRSGGDCVIVARAGFSLALPRLHAGCACVRARACACVFL